MEINKNFKVKNGLEVGGNITVSGTLIGNSDTATRLVTSRTLEFTGDATASGSFDGSSNYSQAITLATVNANVGAFGSSTEIPTFTVNEKGLVTAVSTVTIQDISTSASPIFNSLSLTNPLSIASGGTNSSASPTLGGVGYGTGTAHAYTAAGTVGQVLTSNGNAAPTWQSIGENLPLILNDISNQLDGRKNVFDLKQDQTNITNNNIKESKNLEVVVNGRKLSPYVKQGTTPWLTPYDSYNGFRVVATSTSSYVIIYNTPDSGDQATLTIINSSNTNQVRKYPYSATTIALGD